MARINFGSEIKKQLLLLNIKSPCCKKSFITGAEIFAKSRKNEFTEALSEYKERLQSKKKRAFFDEQVDIGYQRAEENAEVFPVSHGRVCQYCHAAMLRGAFMVCGRASRGENDIHLEMSMPSERAASVVAQSLAELGIEPKKTVRRGEILLYYKKREAVSDFIAYIGAVSLSFDIINDSIIKERRAVANRQKNCDTTNIMKSLSAAERQTAAISAIIAHGALDELPINLRETAMIRLENPIESLDEITELHRGEISRSGVNHRLARIIEFAKKKGYNIT
ncbi:MAG: DNA-binding protein WhiA [Clostridia bacterium]|nr:DNA-binding protein WhiA [Clostridia bacterium]